MGSPQNPATIQAELPAVQGKRQPIQPDTAENPGFTIYSGQLALLPLTYGRSFASNWFTAIFLCSGCVVCPKTLHQTVINHSLQFLMDVGDVRGILRPSNTCDVVSDTCPTGLHKWPTSRALQASRVTSAIRHLKVHASAGIKDFVLYVRCGRDGPSHVKPSSGPGMQRVLICRDPQLTAGFSKTTCE